MYCNVCLECYVYIKVFNNRYFFVEICSFVIFDDSGCVGGIFIWLFFNEGEVYYKDFILMFKFVWFI